MLAQTIQISFNSYAADTIRIHTGETGREIAFVPDMDISGEYNADFIVIKPDDTFVIAAATITDGKINVEIPEQAGAVAGAGHYILKIYDSGSVCIYSASGGFMVDDHLLNDSLIESVAEVYGYRFPQDFARIDDEATESSTTWSSEKIAEEIAEATPNVIDDSNVLYDKTWSSEKIAHELGNVPDFHVYTTTEQPVGRWIDGSMLYERTFTILSFVATTMEWGWYTGAANLTAYMGDAKLTWPVTDKTYITLADTTTRQPVYIDTQNPKIANVYFPGTGRTGTLTLTLQYIKTE